MTSDCLPHQVLVTHSVGLTVLRADKVVAMQAGRVVAVGPPDAGIREIQELVKQATGS